VKKLTALLALTVAVAALGASAPAFSLDKVSSVGTHKPPQRHPRHEVSTYKCGNDLGYLRRVYEDQVAEIIDASIVPICEDDGYGLMRSEGNAGAIRQDLAANGDVMDALDFANFNVDDVVGVRMTGDESAIIYVHTFHYR
jgi:hypothetical protein